MWLIPIRILSVTIFLYAHFKTAKQLESKGCNRSEEEVCVVKKGGKSGDLDKPL